jgi:hypothetical protein
MKNTISQFIPIILIFLLLAHPKESAIFCHSILGRLLAISIIIFYSDLDKYMGLLVCGLVIYYYQLDYVESMNNYEEFIDGNFAKVNDSNSILQKEDKILESNTADTLKDEFRKQNCSGDTLKYKNYEVKSEMVHHIFPELEFKKEICNPCKKSCEFSLIEAKLNLEELMRPISTLA